MNKAVWAVVAVVVVVGGYFVLSGKSLDESVEAVKTQPEAVTEAATDAAADAADAATDAAAVATEAATGATAETATSVTDEVKELFTVDGFNFEKVAEYIDGSELGGMQKTMLKTGLSKAQENPDLLKETLAKAREALGF